MTTFREFWARSAHFEQNGGGDDSRGARVICVVIQTTFPQLCNGRFPPNLDTKRILVSVDESAEAFWKINFRGHFPPKSEIKSRSNRLLAQSRLQVTRCAIEICCLLHVVIQGPMSFRDRTIFLCDVRLRSYGSSKFPNFRILAYFPHTKPPQKVPSGDQPTAQGLHRRMTTIFSCGSRRSKGVPTGSGVFLRLLVEELRTPKLAQILAYNKWLYPYMIQNATTRRVRSGPKMSENAQFQF